MLMVAMILSETLNLKKRGPYNERIYTENAEENDEDEDEQRNLQHQKHVLEASGREEEDDQFDEPPKQISHKEFASMIDALKSKALETI